MNPTQEIIKIFVKVVTEMFQDFTVVLFVSFTWIASMNIQAIAEDVSVYFASMRDAPSQRILKWQKNYFTTLEYIEEIDHFFGPTTLIIFATLLFQTCVYSFIVTNFFLNAAATGIPQIFVVKMITNVLLVVGFILGTERMKAKVISQIADSLIQ